MTNPFSKHASALRFVSLLLIIPTLLVTVSLLSQPHSTVFAELATPSDQLVVTPLPSPTDSSTTPSATLAPSPTETLAVTPSATLSPTPTTEPSTTPTTTLSPTEIPKSEAEPSTQSATALQEAEAPSRLPKQDPGSTPPFEPEYVPGEVLVQYKSNFNPDSLIGKIQVQMLTSSADVEAAEQVASNNLALYTIQSEKTVEETVAELEQSSAVEFAQPNYIYRTQNIGTNDTYANEMWALKNVGQTVNGTAGVIDADIDGSEAWTLSTGSNVIVAVIDTGVYYTHPDLQANMWDGSACKSDTNTTLGGCVHGYDYMDNDKTPLPTTSDHGTHVAGTIAAVKNNGIGVAGVAPSAKIMAIKTDLTSASNIKSVNFARYNGAKIINASWGGYGYDAALKTAIDNYPGLFVAAAGNDALNSSITPMYPCAFTSSNIICVAASTETDSLADFSNYGATHVDIAAPGANIMSSRLTSTLNYPLYTDFNTLVPPNIPSGWSKTGDWGSYSFGGDEVIYGDVNNVPYLPNKNTLMTTSTYSLNGTNGAEISFLAQCDTDYSSPFTGSDYMTLEVSANGTTFSEAMRWNEWWIDSDVSSSGAAFAILEYDLPSQYLTSTFKMRLRWVTNSSGSGSAGDGCFVDDMRITTYTNSPNYGLLSGTSMAAPHVAGAAALAISYAPSLSAEYIKEFIINSGDTPAALSGLVFGGRRLNAKNLLDSVKPDVVYRFWNQIEGNHFYTINKTEWLDVIKRYPSIWKYEGLAYQASSTQGASEVPLYRFWNLQSGQHFYTANSGEKDWLIATYPHIWQYEGIAYYILPLESTAPSQTIYRFWRPDKNHHFYTGSSVERDWIIATYPNIWTYEGEAFKVSN